MSLTEESQRPAANGRLASNAALRTCAATSGLIAFAVVQFRNTVVRYVVFAAVIATSVHLLWKGQHAWQEASRLSEKVIAELPATPSNGRLFVHDLPDHVNGAFVFRNGFAEALLLAGRDTAGMVLVRDPQAVELGPEDLLWSPGIERQ